MMLRVTILLLCAGAMNAADAGNVRLPRLPAVSPDGRQVVFAWRGDLWSLPTTGGTARRLTAHPAEETYSAFSRDGKLIAFNSTRNGYDNIYVMNADGTGLRQVVNIDRPAILAGFCLDDAARPAILFSARIEQSEYPSPRSYLVSVDGGEPSRLFEAYGYAPAVSPDGSKVLFTRGGVPWTRRNYRGPDARNVWLLDRISGAYTQLTAWNGNDGRARWIDNQSFVYASDREDRCVNLYRLAMGQSERQAQRLTHFTQTDVEEFDISADGRTLVFAMWDRLYRLDLSDPAPAPAPIEIAADEDTNDRVQVKSVDRLATHAALSPDGKALAVIAYGQLYVRGVEAKAPTRRVTSPPVRCTDVTWSADGEKLFFTCDATGYEAIYEASVRLTRAEVRKQVETIGRGEAVAARPMERESGGQPLDPATRATDPATEPAKSGGHAATQQATQTTGQSNGADPESAGSDRADAKEEATQGKDKKDEKSRWADAVAFDVAPLVSIENQMVSMPSPSPDGRHLAYRRGVGQLWVMDLNSREHRLLLDGWSDALDWRWSPDSRHIAYVTEDYNNNADIWIVPADASSSAVNITRHPDNDTQPRWSADGRIMAFVSDRVNNEGDVWMVFLDKSLESLTPAELEQYYKDAAGSARKREIPKKATTRPATQPTTQPATRLTTKPGAAPSPPILDLDDAYLRLKRVTSLPGDERDLELTPAGDRYLFTGQAGAARATFTVDKDAGEPKRIAAAVNVQHLSFEGEKAVVIDPGTSREGGRPALMKLPGGELEHLEVADKLVIDLAAQSVQKFREAARLLQHTYYDPKLNGLDWPAVTERYLSLARAAMTASEWDHVVNKLVGELNGSHLGVDTPEPRSDQQQPMGRLGIRRKRVGDVYEVQEVFEQGPAGKGPMRLQPGDRITHVEGLPIGASDSLETMLQGRVGKETLFTVRRGAGEAEQELSLLLTPISYEAESAVFYHDWRTKTAGKVAEMSGGKIGYIHIRGMDQGSLDLFERDLFAAADGKKGLIIDVRNNGGGWTTDRLLASIMYPRHAYTRPRGVPEHVTDAYPQDRLFIQRCTLPINMLCNEKSFSNAEIISHAFKTLRRGTLVGQQTAGGVISTGGATLIDGTTVRIPFRGWWLPDGTNMELNGAIPDILLPQTPEAEARQEDEQLKAAVEDLMKRVG